MFDGNAPVLISTARGTMNLDSAGERRWRYMEKARTARHGIGQLGLKDCVEGSGPEKVPLQHCGLMCHADFLIRP